MKQLKTLLDLRLIAVAFFLAVGAPLGLAGCDSNDGPAEEMGEKIDEGVEEAKDEYDDATTE